MTAGWRSQARGWSKLPTRSQVNAVNSYTPACRSGTWFAGQAMMGAASNPEQFSFYKDEDEGQSRADQQSGLAEWCYDFADATLAEREKRDDD